MMLFIMIKHIYCKNNTRRRYIWRVKISTVERDFDREVYEEVMKWVEDTIKLIDEEEFYEPKNDEKFFCHNLCNHRETCSFLPEF